MRLTSARAAAVGVAACSARTVSAVRRGRGVAATAARRASGRSPTGDGQHTNIVLPILWFGVSKRAALASPSGRSVGAVCAGSSSAGAQQRSVPLYAAAFPRYCKVAPSFLEKVESFCHSGSGGLFTSLGTVAQARKRCVSWGRPPTQRNALPVQGGLIWRTLQIALENLRAQTLILAKSP